MAVEHTSVSGELFTRSSESQRLSALWQQLSVGAREEIERRAKANGFSLMDQLRVSFPAQSEAPASIERRPPRATPPTMAELVRALDELVELMKRK
jgi:hypothetical protein